MDSSTVLAVDLSFDLPMRGLWEVCRQAAIMAADSIRARQGLSPLVIGFNDSARWLDVSDLADLEYNAVYGTNVQHALSLARYELDGAGAAKRILLIAEVEPTSHCDAHGESYFDFPPSPETRRITLNEARACAVAGIRVDLLLLTINSKFRPLAAEIAKECGGSMESLSGLMPTSMQIEEFLSKTGF